MKDAISVTLERGNLLWLRGQAILRKRRNLSETLDAVIAEARNAPTASKPRSVRRLISLDPNAPDLAAPDPEIRRLFERSLERTARQLRGDFAPTPRRRSSNQRTKRIA